MNDPYTSAAVCLAGHFVMEVRPDVSVPKHCPKHGVAVWKKGECGHRIPGPKRWPKWGPPGSAPVACDRCNRRHPWADAVEKKRRKFERQTKAAQRDRRAQGWMSSISEFFRSIPWPWKTAG